MDVDTVKNLMEGAMGEYFWWFVGAAAMFFFKSTIENFVSGLTFLLGNDYNVDDEVWIGGSKRARIVRQSLTKTVFYLYDNNRRLIIPNKQLYGLKCEKVLPTLPPERQE